ncbi:DUF4145 domain-containing protein [Mesorhizobium sp. M0025]|uniref:DUF4145 domain-containing protein n=1 Tax=Mesorhizobium sp. M0025 TaxID=2956846 RepID=UPI0033373568
MSNSPRQQSRAPFPIALQTFSGRPPYVDAPIVMRPPEQSRKTIDVASKHLYATDARLAGRNPADALRSRLKALGDLKILDEEIVELADVAALDGNDAAHDIDPYTAGEAEAMEDLTADLLDRLFVRPAKLAAVKAKQIAAGQRKPL